MNLLGWRGLRTLAYTAVISKQCDAAHTRCVQCRDLGEEPFQLRLSMPRI